MGDFVLQIMDNVWANVLFDLVLAVIYGVAILALLILGQLIRMVWIFLFGSSVNNVVVYVERRALRGR